MNNMFKLFFQTWIGGTIYYIFRILGKCNNKGICLIISTVILEGYLSIHILQNRCFFISVNKADTACE